MWLPYEHTARKVPPHTTPLLLKSHANDSNSLKSTACAGVEAHLWELTFLVAVNTGRHQVVYFLTKGKGDHNLQPAYFLIFKSIFKSPYAVKVSRRKSLSSSISTPFAPTLVLQRHPQSMCFRRVISVSLFHSVLEHLTLVSSTWVLGWWVWLFKSLFSPAQPKVMKTHIGDMPS